MIEHNVPVTPGTGIVKDVDEVREFAQKVGYPVIIKAKNKINTGIIFLYI